MTLVA